MKPDIHPEYRPVVFQDQSSGDNIIIGSTMETRETITLDGVEYPLAKVELSSRSHPFFTGTMKIVDTAGRVERFERRYGSRRKKAAAAAEQAADSEPKTAAARKAVERQALPKKAAAKSKAEKVPAKKAPATKVAAKKAVDDKVEAPEAATDAEPIEATEKSGES